MATADDEDASSSDGLAQATAAATAPLAAGGVSRTAAAASTPTSTCERRCGASHEVDGDESHPPLSFSVARRSRREEGIRSNER